MTIKIDHPALFAPVEIQKRWSLFHPLVAVFTDASGKKIEKPPVVLLIGGLPEKVLKDEGQTADVIHALRDTYMTDPDIRASIKQEFSGAKWQVRRVLSYAHSIFAEQRDIFWPSRSGPRR